MMTRDQYLDDYIARYQLPHRWKTRDGGVRIPGLVFHKAIRCDCTDPACAGWRMQSTPEAKIADPD
jgi:hypothetical protein